MPLGRKTERQRRTLHIRFGPDPEQAREERKLIERALRITGDPNLNTMCKRLLLVGCKQIIEMASTVRTLRAVRTLQDAVKR